MADSQFIQWQLSSRNGATKLLTLTTVNASSSAFGPQTFQVRIAATNAANYSVGDGTQTVTTTSMLLLPNWIEYVTCTPGQNICVRLTGADGLNSTSTTGSLWITEMC